MSVFGTERVPASSGIYRLPKEAKRPVVRGSAVGDRGAWLCGVGLIEG